MPANGFQNYQLQRIADAIYGGMAGGGSLTVDVTGVGDMQGATANTDGVHGLVPQPLQGDEDKVLKGDGTWGTIQAVGGVDYSTSEQDTGLKWIDGKSIYQKTFSFTGIRNPSDWTYIDTISNMDTPIKAECLIDFYSTAVNDMVDTFGYDYVKCMVYPTTGAVYYYANQLGGGTANIVITVWYTKTI